MTKIRALNDRGVVIGESHGRAKLSDRQVDEMRDLYEEENWRLVDLSTWFGVAVSTVHDIISYNSRAQTPVAWRKGRKVIR